MRKLIALAALATMAALTACASVSEVMKVGPDSYMVGTSVHGGFTSDTEVKSGAIKRAQAYCGASGKQMALVSSQSSGTQGWMPQNAEIIFKCE